MERRVILAVLLAIGVLFLTPRLFPPARRTTLTTAGTESTRVAPPPATISPQPAEAIRPVDTSSVVADTSTAAATLRTDSVVVSAADGVFVFQNPGAVLEHVRLI